MSDVVLSVPVNAGGVDPLLAALEKINENLAQINVSSKGSFDLFAKSLDKSNKKLKETDKTFGDIFKKIKLSGLMKMGAGVIGAGAGLLGLSTGAMLFGALRNSAGNIATGYQAKGLGMSTAEMKALQVASKLTTGKEETLVTALDSLTTAMRTAEGQTALTALGLNIGQLKSMKPEDALQAVFNAVKGKGTGVGFEYLQQAFSQVTGLSDKDYATATKQGAAFESFYNEFLAKFADVDFDALGRGSQSMVKFQSQLDIVSSQLGAKVADPLSAVLDKLTPWLDKFGDWLAALLGSITKEDVDSFMQNVQTVFGFIGNVASGLTTSTSNPDKISKTVEQAMSGEAGAEKTLATTLSLGLQTLGDMFTAEGREENRRFGTENSLRAFMTAGYDVSKLRQLNPELVARATEYGYIKDGQYTEKAQALRVEIVVKDPAGNVLSSGIQTQAIPAPANPTRKPRAGVGNGIH